MKLEWTAEQLALVGSAPDVEVAKQLGVSRMMIGRKRKELGLPPFPVKACGHDRQTQFEWTEDNLALLGKVPDMDLALILGVSRRTVWHQRKLRNIPVMRSESRYFALPDEAVPFLGVLRDAVIAHRFNVPTDTVYNARRVRNIEAPAKLIFDYAMLLPDLGTAPDPEVAAKHNTSTSIVRQARLKLNIPAFKRVKVMTWLRASQVTETSDKSQPNDYESPE